MHSPKVWALEPVGTVVSTGLEGQDTHETPFGGWPSWTRTAASSGYMALAGEAVDAGQQAGLFDVEGVPLYYDPDGIKFDDPEDYPAAGLEAVGSPSPIANGLSPDGRQPTSDMRTSTGLEAEPFNWNTVVAPNIGPIPSDEELAYRVMHINERSFEPGSGRRKDDGRDSSGYAQGGPYSYDDDMAGLEAPASHWEITTVPAANIPSAVHLLVQEGALSDSLLGDARRAGLEVRTFDLAAIPRPEPGTETVYILAVRSGLESQYLPTMGAGVTVVNLGFSSSRPETLSILGALINAARRLGGLLRVRGLTYSGLEEDESLQVRIYH